MSAITRSKGMRIATASTQQSGSAVIRRPVDVAALQQAARQTISSPRGGARRRVLPAELVEQLAQSDRWREVAACRDEDPELFFPVGSSGPAKVQEAEALAVCARCPALERCRRNALDTGDQYGIRGGLTEAQRRNLLRQSVNPTTKHAQTHNSAGKQRPVVASQGSTDADFEAAMSGMTVLVPSGVKVDLARRMFAAGKSKNEIGRALRMSGRTVKRAVELAEERAVS